MIENNWQKQYHDNVYKNETKGYIGIKNILYKQRIPLQMTCLVKLIYITGYYQISVII